LPAQKFNWNFKFELMASLNKKNSWSDIFNTPTKHTTHSLVDDEKKKYSREDSFSRFAKNVKYRNTISDYKLESDLIYVEDSDSLFNRLIKKIGNSISNLIKRI
jgi:hypothetical protein